MADLLHFKPRKELVWECECGCQEFTILKSEEVRCVACSCLVAGLRVILDDKEEKDDV